MQFVQSSGENGFRWCFTSVRSQFCGKQEGSLLRDIDFSTPVRPKPSRAEVIGRKQLDIWIGFGIALGCALLYGPCARFAFVNFDDPWYVIRNPVVLKGLTWEGVKFAFTNVEGFYHPLTWLSLMLDATIGHAHPWAFHLTNLWIHSFNSVLVFFLAYKLSGHLWPSTLVAILFSCHPLNVESVGWVSERKGLLAAAFGLSSFWFYLQYAKNSKVRTYVLMWTFFLLSLMSKTTLFAFPFILLCVDWWPLERFGWKTSTKTNSASWVLLEKVPLLITAVVFFYLTILAELQVGAVKTSEFPLDLRIYNAVYSLVWYLCSIVFPHHLTFFYAFPTSIDILQFVFRALAIGLLGIMAFLLTKKWPILTVALTAFFLLIAPVLGIVKIGAHARADRYMYLAMLPMLTVIASVARSAWSRPRTRYLSGSVISLLIVFQLVSARTTLEKWRSSDALFRQALRVNPDTFLPYVNYASYLMRTDKYPDALYYLDRALELEPRSATALHDKGVALQYMGKTSVAVGFYRSALEIEPEMYVSLIQLARLHLDNKDSALYSPSEAKLFAKRAVVLQANSRDPWELLIRAYYATGQAAIADRTLGIASKYLVAENKH